MLSGLALLPRGLRAAEFQWKFGIEQGPDDPIVLRSVQAFSRIKEETAGRLQIASFPNSALGGQPAMLSQLREGALEVLGYNGSGLDSVVPVAGICGVGFAFKDAPTACAAFDGELGDLVRREILAKGMVPLKRVWNPGFLNLNMVTKPIRNADDLATVKIRVAPSKTAVDLIKSMGGSATPLASTEVYTALTTHLVDGVDTSFSALISIGWVPVVKYISLSEHRWNLYWTLINPGKWASLPRNIQEIVEKNLDAATLAQRRDVAARERSIVDKLSRTGIAFNTPDKSSFKAKLRATGYYARQKDEFGGAAWSTLAKYSDIV